MWARGAAIVLVLLGASGIAGAERARVTIEVRDSAGTLVSRSYVALVPVWRPWSRPAVEEISTRGRSELDVAPGTYNLVAGARGFAMGVQESVTIASGSRPSFTLTLAPLEELQGRVTRSDGRPIAGARVTTAHGAVRIRPGKFSDLATRHLGDDWSTTTDREGRFRIQVASGSVPLRFEAKGFAGEWHVRPDAAKELHVRLSPGGGLQLVTDRTDSNVVVTLTRNDEQNAAAILDDEQELVWARRADAGALVWDSLPPGTYRVRARYPDPRYFDRTPATIATVQIIAGQEHVARATLPPARKPAAGTTELFFWKRTEKHLGDELALFGVDTSCAPRRLPHVLERVIDGTLVHVDTEGARPPFYATTADSFYATVSDLTEDGAMAAPPPWPVLPYRRADVVFQPTFADEELQRPTSALVTIDGCRNIPRVKTAVTIDGTLGRFSAPAGCASLVIDVQPFEPVIVSQSLRPGEQDLGAHVLRGAGGAEVRVLRDPEGTVVPGAKVRAVSAEASASAVVIGEATTDERGWARLDDLPSYWPMRIVAELDGEVASGVELHVRPKERAVIDPLRLASPATLLVQARLDPEFASRFPSAQILTLTATPADGSDKRRQNVDAREEPVRFDRLTPGTWLLSAVVRVAGTFAPIDVAEVELKAGAERRIDATLTPKVFRGTVTSDGKGVAAKLMIDVHGMILNVNTDTSGAFTALFEEEGVYRVAGMRLESQGNIIPIGDVRFVDPAQPIDIALPERGEVKTVVRRDGRALPGASVWISRRGHMGEVDGMTKRARTTDAAGETTFQDLAPGRWTFSVLQSDGSAAAENAAVVEGGRRLVLELDLKPALAIRGTIRDLGGGPLPRAQVDCVHVGPTGMVDQATTETDGNGAFELALVPPAPREAFCSVATPLGAVDAFRATPGQRVEIAMPAATARVRFTNGKNPRSELWLVMPDGRAVSLAAVSRKLRSTSGSLDIAALPAVPWRLVHVTSAAERLAVARGAGAALPARQTLALRAGATETIPLEVP